jgi:hypothetical protein
VPEIVTMTVHDRMLHEEILEARACTPDAIRRTALKVAATGLAGPTAAQAAKAAAKADDDEVVGAHFLLVMALFAHLGIPRAELMEIGRDGSRWRAVARRTLNAAAGELHVAPSALYEHMQDLARTLAPIGLANTPLQLADAALAELDRSVSDMGVLLCDWGQVFPRLRRSAQRLAWLLDGWDFVVSLWDFHRGGSVQERRDALIQIHRVLPLIPRKELERAGPDADQRDLARGGRVRPMQDWRTGRYDLDLVARIEAVKSLALSKGETRPDEAAAPEPKPSRSAPARDLVLDSSTQGAR